MLDKFHSLLVLLEEGDESFVNGIAHVMMAFSAITFLSGLYVETPYGRYYKQWTVFGERKEAWPLGPYINPKLAWFLFESPTVIGPLLFFYLNRNDAAMSNSVNCFLLGLFFFHATYRALIYPLRIRNGRPMPLVTLLLTIGFNVLNAYVQSQYLTHFSISNLTTTSPQFIVGVILFFTGWLINYHSDNILRNLRSKTEETTKEDESKADSSSKKKGSGYRIPTGGFFEWVSAANYFGETIEWFGFSIASGFSSPSLAFALMTASNLIPRAIHHHRWYLNNFPNYPKNRKAVIPFLL